MATQSNTVLCYLCMYVSTLWVPADHKNPTNCSYYHIPLLRLLGHIFASPREKTTFYPSRYDNMGVHITPLLNPYKRTIYTATIDACVPQCVQTGKTGCFILHQL